MSLKQPIQALQHPAFKTMIDIASRATHGVKISSHKQTRQAVIDSFKQNLINIQMHLLVCPINTLTSGLWHSTNKQFVFNDHRVILSKVVLIWHATRGKHPTLMVIFQSQGHGLRRIHQTFGKLKWHYSGLFVSTMHTMADVLGRPYSRWSNGLVL